MRCARACCYTAGCGEDKYSDIKVMKIYSTYRVRCARDCCYTACGGCGEDKYAERLEMLDG